MLEKYSHLVSELARLVPEPVTDKMFFPEDERYSIVNSIESHIKDLTLSNVTIIPMMDGGLLNSIGDPVYYDYLAVMTLIGRTLPFGNKGEYKNKMFSFTEIPELVQVSTNISLLIDQISSQGMVMSVDVMAVLDLLLERIHNIPDQLLIVSDDTGNSMMQGEPHDLTHMKNKYNEVGVSMPLIVYWNIAAKEHNMFIDNSGIQLVNGLNDNNLDCVLSGKYLNS